MSELQKLRTPQGKEARQFAAAIQGLIISAQQPGSETGEQAETVISHWIGRLTDLSPEQVDALSLPDTVEYQNRINLLLVKLMAKTPAKKP